MPTVAIAASASGDNQIVAGVSGKCIRVLGFVLSFAGTVNAKWRSAANDRTGLVYGVAGAVLSSPHLGKTMSGQTPQFTCEAGEDLNLNLSGATAVGGYVVYDTVLPQQI